MSTSPRSSIPLEEIASCFEGVIPSPVCTCSSEGTPNITYLSSVNRIDADHVALSFQFFNKTKKNIQENPRAQVILVEPETIRQYRLDLVYERTESKGPIFDRMKIQLDAIAAQTGMADFFKLRGADIYRVLSCRPLSADSETKHSERRIDHLQALDEFTNRIAACTDLDSLLSTSLDGLHHLFNYEHTFLLVLDEEERHFYTIASRGYEASGIGSEIAAGEGIIGMVAERRSSVRYTNMARELLLSRAVRSGLESHEEAGPPELEIPLPGLEDVQSQLAVPLLAQNQLLGVLCLQSNHPGRFQSEDEQVVEVAARHMAACMALLQLDVTRDMESLPQRLPGAVSQTEPAVIKHYHSDDSVFIDDDYLIKGVPGRVFWKLVRAHVEEGRVDFTNKEIRLDSSLKLPEIKDNLETRLILLRRRLEERCHFLRVIPTGRGRFRLEVQKRLSLEELT